MHLLSMEWDLSRQRNPLEFSLQQQLLDSRIITKNLFRTVYDNATHYRSFLDYENLIWLAHCCGSEVGDQLHSRNTAASMLGVIYRTDRVTIKTFISTPSAATGRLPQVDVAADKVSDKRFKQWQCNALRVNLVGSPWTFCSELKKMGLTAKGVDCHKNMVESASDLGVTATQRKTYSFDGEACYSGAGTTADTVKSLVLEEDPKNEVLHDPPHAGELNKEDMQREFVYITEIHDLIRAIYGHISFQGKKLTGMEMLAKDLGVEWHELHYIFPVRMVESEYIAVRAFMLDYQVLVTTLTTDANHLQSSSNLTDQATASKCKHWVRRMREFKFVAVSLCLLDLDKQAKIFSKAQQGDVALALEYPTNHERYKSALEAMSNGVLGSHVKRNLGSLKSGKYAGVPLLGLDEEVIVAKENTICRDPDLFELEAIVGKEKAGRGFRYCVRWLGYPDTENAWFSASQLKKTAPVLVQAYERGDSAADQQAAARAARLANRVAFKAPEEAVDSLAQLTEQQKEAAETAILKRVGRYSKAMADGMLRTFDDRLPMPAVLMHLRTMFDFRRMPWGDNSKLETWSNDSIAWLVEHKFPELDLEIVQSEALKVRFWLRDRLARFRVDVPVHNADGDVVKGTTKEELALCGDGSIFNVLFTQHDELFPSSITSYLYMADYNISYICTQCATERIGRNMTLTKTPERSSLSDDHFKQLVWVSYNGAPIHEVDFSQYVDVWIKEKHQLAVFMSGGEQKVLERKAHDHKHTILSNNKVQNKSINH